MQRTNSLSGLSPRMLFPDEASMLLIQCDKFNNSRRISEDRLPVPRWLAALRGLVLPSRTRPSQHGQRAQELQGVRRHALRTQLTG